MSDVVTSRPKSKTKTKSITKSMTNSELSCARLLAISLIVLVFGITISIFDAIAKLLLLLWFDWPSSYFCGRIFSASVFRPQNQE